MLFAVKVGREDWAVRFVRALVNAVRARARWDRMRWVAARGAWRGGPRGRESHGSDSEAARVPHLVVLLQAFPPEVSGGVYRPLALAKYAAQFGWRVTVLAGRVRQDVGEAGEYLLRHLPVDAAVHRPDGPELRFGRRLLPRLDGGPLELLERFELGGKVLRSDPPDVVLATGPPFNSFVAARYLADAFSVPLILDYRDEWTEGTQAFVRVGPKDRAIETACLARADRVTFATEPIERLYLAAFPFLPAARCRTIRNGWDPQDVSEAEALGVADAGAGEEAARGDDAGVGGEAARGAGAEFSGDAPQGTGAASGTEGAGDAGDAGLDRPTILHAGSLVAHTAPDPFLEHVARILARREDLRRGLRIRFIGRGSGDAPAQLAAFPHSDVLEVVDNMLPKPATLLEMRRAAAVLLLNGPKCERALPGKFYEYVAMGTPVLVHGDTGEISRIVRELDAGWVVPIGDDAALEAALEHVAARAVRSGDPARIAAWLDDHTREAMSRRFFAVADDARRASAPWH